MTNTAISMSGLMSLDENQAELLQCLGFDVPTILTAEALIELVAKARVLNSQDPGSTLAPAVNQVLDDIETMASTSRTEML